MKDYNEMTRRVLERRDRYEIEQKQRHQRMRRRVTTGVCAFVAVFVGLSAWLTVDTEARAYVKALWKKRVYGERTTYIFTPSGTFTSFPEVELTWLPEGYELVEVEMRTDEQRGIDYMLYSYRNDEKGTEFFLYITSIEDMPVISYKPFKSMEVSVNGQKAEYLYVENDKGVAWAGTLMWVDAQRDVRYELWSGLVHQGFTVDDFVKIAEGLVVDREDSSSRSDPSGTFTGFPEVEMTWLPEGYELVEVDLYPFAETGKNRKWYTYEKSETETRISLCITLIEDIPEFSVVRQETTESEEVSVNGKPAEFLRQKTPDGTKWWVGHLMWADEERGVYYQLVLPLLREDFTVDDFVKIAEGLVIVE